MKYILQVFFLLIGLNAIAQNCNIQLKGKIIDQHDNSALLFTNLYIEEIGKGAVADTNGEYIFEGLCPGKYHVVASHIGCEPVTKFFTVSKDTSVNFSLEHHSTFLEAVHIEGKANKSTIQEQTSISREDMDGMIGKNLADISSEVIGVRAIKNGSSIGKPVINGLYGNRVGIINNGIPQGGQQWGVDHAPEIDPFGANTITIVKGVDALEYGGSGIGGLVLVEPGVIKADPHVHGSGYYQFQSNGIGHLGALRLERGGKLIRWRVSSSLQQRGDQESPDYYLTNTGFNSQNLSVQLQNSIKNKIFNELYYSYYGTELGVLRGSHLGNITDLENAISSEEPLYTSDDFSYNIAAPKQEVQHHLVKSSVKYLHSENLSLKYIYSFQLNNRAEFDVRRSGREDIPALELNLNSHFNNLYMVYKLSSKYALKTGIQYQFQENVNNPETGILPLIPDYQKNQVGVYTKLKREFKKGTLEIGGRYDFIDYDVFSITRTIPRSIEHVKLQFQTYSALMSFNYEVNENWNTIVSTGVAQRNPEVNELFSNGLHQGVAGLEEGNSNLDIEKSYKISWANEYKIKKYIELSALVYTQLIDDYIYLQAEEEFRQTIRGTFPVYTYNSTNAMLSGLDLALLYKISPSMQVSPSYSIVRGEDRSNNTPLVYMPADRLGCKIIYKALDLGKIEQIKFTTEATYTFDQNRLNDDQDFLEPPSGYFLLNAGIETTFKIWKKESIFYIKGENVLNESYRDYLNRLRYYADEVGINVLIGLRQHF